VGRKFDGLLKKSLLGWLVSPRRKKAKSWGGKKKEKKTTTTNRGETTYTGKKKLGPNNPKKLRPIWAVLASSSAHAVRWGKEENSLTSTLKRMKRAFPMMEGERSCRGERRDPNLSNYELGKGAHWVRLTTSARGGKVSSPLCLAAARRGSPRGSPRGLSWSSQWGCTRIHGASL